jgi:hypothetical protein
MKVCNMRATCVWDPIAIGGFRNENFSLMTALVSSRDSYSASDHKIESVQEFQTFTGDKAMGDPHDYRYRPTSASVCTLRQ